MPINRITNLQEAYVEVLNASAGSQTGSKVTFASPVRGQLIEVGFMPSSLVASACST